MTTHNLKLMLFTAAMLLVFCCGSYAQINIGRLAGKAKEAVKNEVKKTAQKTTDKAEEKAVSGVEQKTGSEPEHTTVSNEPQVNEESYIDEKYKALDYWLNLQETAINKKDIEWLTSDKNTKVSDCFNLILNDELKEVASKHKFGTVETRFRDLAGRANALLYEGQPKYNGVESLPGILQWALDKAKAGEANTRAFYTVNGAAMRQLCYSSGRYAESAAAEKIIKEYIPLWDSLDEAYKAKYPNCDPRLTYADIQAKEAAVKKEREEREAKAEAERKARIEAAKQTLTPGALNASLNAAVLKLAKQREPKCERVVVISNNWKIHHRGANISHRTITAWVVYRNKDGNLVASDYSFAQDYQGGGKYGALRNHGVGLSTVYVK